MNNNYRKCFFYIGSSNPLKTKKFTHYQLVHHSPHTRTTYFIPLHSQQTLTFLPTQDGTPWSSPFCTNSKPHSHHKRGLITHKTAHTFSLWKKHSAENKKILLAIIWLTHGLIHSEKKILSSSLTLKNPESTIFSSHKPLDSAATLHPSSSNHHLQSSPQIQCKTLNPRRFTPRVPSIFS